MKLVSDANLKKLSAKRYAVIATALLVFAVAACGCGSGGGGGGAAPAAPPADTTPPVVGMSYPLDKATVQETDFRSLGYVMTFSYSDVSPINESSISVKFQMDNGDVKDISSYFAAGSMTNTGGKYNYTIVSSGLGTFNRNLYDIHGPNIPTADPVMKATLSVKDIYGNIGTVSSQFTVHLDIPK